MFLKWIEVPYRVSLCAHKYLALKNTEFWCEVRGQSPDPQLNNFSDYFLNKNSNFCDFEKDYTSRFSKQFEKKIS